VTAPQESLAEYLQRAEKVVALSGAGLSAESGVPTFRGAAGLWAKYDPYQLATPEAFARDPQLVWEFYNLRRATVRECRPNAAHEALAALETLVPRFIHVTQNVDGLAQQAGGRNVIELHGNLFATVCAVCGSEHPHHADELPFPAHCQRCGGLLRPGVVWFGEPVRRIGEAAQAVQGCDVCLIVGTSNVVYPAASLAAVAKQGGARLAEFNVEKTPLSEAVDFLFLGPVGETLPPVVDRLRNLR
jgi:NAD-dependent deacetylase